ncbi:MAG: sigma-54-dependent Fis family transcriptional regulator [Thermodesulfatator sp.]|nr:MAG: sigma-54-dependent Fis family transcriptional regulator [Thermodesulfatator sp.]
MAILFWTPSGRLQELAEELAREHPVRLLSDLSRELSSEPSPELLVAEVSPEGPSPRQILDIVRRHRAGLPVLFLAEKATVEEAVEAIRAGAYDFRLLSTEKGLLHRIIQAALEERRLFSGEEGFLTRDPGLRTLLERLRPVARSPAPVLITGESGTGKEVLARWIHRISDRARGPFLAINCAALPEALLESELFGYEKGAFSGALTRKKGKFELADGGTILLDEITEMPLPLQAKLLRVLQEGEVDRLGGAYPVKVDVRVIATTNRDIEEEVRAGRFREDLYFRLNVIPVRLPPLRERRADIPYLAEHFLREFSQRYHKAIRGFHPEVLEIFERYPFPGNVRELKNLVERAVLLAQGPEITLEDLLWKVSPSTLNPAEESPPPLKPLRELEKEAILAALKASGGNRTRAAEILGISVRTLRNKLKAFRAQGLL